MRRAAEVTCEAHRRAMQATSAGSNEYEIEATLLRTFQESGSTGPGYTPIVAGGNNANVLHYNRNREVLPEGGMLLVDAGCECGFYTADVTRTWPISGRFTEAQRAVYEVVLAAQDACIETARVGVAHSEIHWAAVRALTEGMVALGLLEGEVDTLIQDESYKRWYPHGTSHWLGLDVHDVGCLLYTSDAADE